MLSVRRVLVAFLAALCLTAVTAQEAAATYEVADVRVDETAETAVQARDAAIKQGQRQALETLLRRMTLQEDHKRLPRLNDATVAGLVQTISVNNERYSTTRYIADLTVGFSPDGVQRILNGADVPFADSLGRSIVVLPVYEDGGVTTLWDNPNPWREAWTGADWRNTLVPFVMPRGGLSDSAIISAGQARAGNTRALGDIAARYGTSEVIVPFARWSIDLQTGDPILIVEMRMHGVEGFRQTSVNVVQQTGESERAFLNRAAREAATLLADDLKKNVIAGKSGLQWQMSAYADINALPQFLSLKHRLQQSPVVRHAQIESMSANRVLMSLTVLGEIDDIQNSLAEYGIDVMADPDREDRWRMALRR